jgi:maltooligosyltrehalose trehalohydrolase
MDDPTAVETFHQSKMDWTEFEKNTEIVLLHKDLLRLRRERLDLLNRVDGSVFGTSAFLLRYFGATPDRDHLLLVNLGTELFIESIPDPLFAPPAACRWETMWSSEAVAYGGSGVRNTDFQRRWTLPGQSALFLATAAAPPSEPPESGRLAEWQRTLSA